MEKYFDSIIKADGKPANGVSILVKTYPAGATATIYSDDGVTTTSNPLTADVNGSFEFYAANGDYTLEITGTGITSKTIDDVSLNDHTDAISAVTVVDLTVTGDTVIGDASDDSLTFHPSTWTLSNDINLSGANVGLGVVPEAWQSIRTALQIGGNASLSSLTAQAASNQLNLTNNAYRDSADWKYISTDQASWYYQVNGTHTFFVAVSDTADNIIAWTSALAINNSAASTFGAPTGGAPAAAGYINAVRYLENNVRVCTGDGTTGGAASAGAGNQYVEIVVDGLTYKVLHDGTV